MNFRTHQSLWLALLLVSCDESKKVSEVSREILVTPRTTKSVRATTGEPLPPAEPPDSVVEPPEEMTPADERNQALSTAAWDAIETDPDLALQTVQQMTTGSEEKNRLLAHFAMRLADQDTDEAIRWASTLTTDEEKALAFGKIALVLSVKEPERAARLLSESGIPGRDFDVAVVQVVQRWAATSPADAAAWLCLFSAGEARSAGLAEVVSVWIRRDSAEAFAWIPTIPDSALRQEAERGAAQFILNEPEISQGDFLKSASAGTLSQLELLKSRRADDED